METRKRTCWTYKGVNVFPAELNGSGIRWTALGLRANTKEGMRQLINNLQNREQAEKHDWYMIFAYKPWQAKESK